MRVLLQRVTTAQVVVAGETVGQIGHGLLLLVAIAPDDTVVTCRKMADKVAALRVFSDENGKINLSLRETGGSCLVVSQFTLYADLHHGRRPYFGQVAAPDMARQLVDTFTAQLRELGITCATGRFGADMAVSLVNDGPVTIMMDSDQI